MAPPPLDKDNGALSEPGKNDDTQKFLRPSSCYRRLMATAQVRVWQGTLTLPTYEEAAPDPNPPFDQYANSRFNYPYTLRDNLTSPRGDHLALCVSGK